MGDFESLVFYIVSYAAATLCFSFYRSENKIQRYSGVLAGIMIPSVIAGMRYDVGTDYKTYYAIFNQLREVSYHWLLTDDWHMQEERMFLVLAKFFTTFFSTKAVFGVFAFFMLVFFTYTIMTQYKEYNLTLVFMAYLFGGFSGSFNTLRQGIAVLIVFYGYRFIVENKPFKFIITVVIAALFHVTALIALPAWFLWNHKTSDNIKWERKLPIFVVAVVFVLFWKQILQFFLGLNLPFISKYMGYLEGNETQNRSFWLKLVILIFFILVKNYLCKNDKRVELFINMYLIGVVLEYTGFFITFVKRIGDYYSFPEIFLLGMLPFMFTTSSRRLVKCGVWVWTIALFTLGSYILMQGGNIPYKIQ